MGGESHRSMAAPSKEYPKLAAGPVGKQIRSLYQARLGQFTDRGQYYEQGLVAKHFDARAEGTPWVKLSVYSPPNLARPLFKEATGHAFHPTNVGESFGPSWSTHWFKVQLTVPPHMLDSEHLEFIWDANNEGLIWTEDGHTVHGLTGGEERTEWILPKEFRDGKEHIFYIEMACNGMFGNAPGGDTIQPPNPNTYYTLRQAEIVAVNLEARALYFDFWEISDAAREFPQDSTQSHDAQQIANRIIDAFIAGNGSQASIKAGRKIAAEYVGDNVDSHKVYDSDMEAIVTGIGYCHIDTCWLWPFDETKRKVNRSWSNQCDLIDRYPELRFCTTQAQQFKWLEQYYPSTFDRVKKKVKEGHFQPIGGSWVEHDTNLPSGESLIRQFLYGQRYFESKFGQRCRTFWLPDTFGYSTQLPQICRISGMTRFLTQKLSWNNINVFPHTTFNWVALDNSQVICHMPPSETYTCEANFGDVKRSVTQHKSLDQDKSSLIVFGKGDGGGGPTWQQLEKLRRCRGISDTVAPGMLPRVKLGDSADDFFDHLEKKVENGMELVTWYGELYFELHRGTYTTQSNNKRNNRKSEIMLRDIEYLATLATIKNGFGKKSSYRYPKKDIDDMWENVLLCQFHDCLPGSSIEMCYDDSDRIYAEVFATGEKLLSDALSELGFDDESTWENDTHLIALNTLPWNRTELIELPASASQTRYGLGGTKYGFAYRNGMGNNGLGALEILPLNSPYAACKVSIEEVRTNVFELRNTQFIVQVENGAIVSLYDIAADRELIPKGAKAAQLVIYDDKPLYWQAWDVEVYHLQSRQELLPTKVTVVESSIHRAAICIETKISDKSWIKTTLSLPAAIGETPTPIEISAEIEWQETMRFLKVEFPVDIVNTEASYETQFGIVRRPTHYNTTWDMAKFEVCCHKFADLSEATYGISILNDSKYGFAVQGNVMRLSLLRSPKAPDAHADMGSHKTRYAIFPHKGPLDERTVRKAFEFNNPLKVVGRSPKNLMDAGLLNAFHIHGADNLVLDTIKRGEDDEDVSRGELPMKAGHSVILRIYDSLGGKSKGILTWGEFDVKKVVKCNALEDEEEEVKIEQVYMPIPVPNKDGPKQPGVQIEVRAFEVATFKLVLE